MSFLRKLFGGKDSEPETISDEQASAMFDLEQRGKARFAVILPYRRGAAGIEFGTLVFRKMEPKLFVS